jgi:hypothetical protein
MFFYAIVQFYIFGYEEVFGGLFGVDEAEGTVFGGEACGSQSERLAFNLRFSRL